MEARSCLGECSQNSSLAQISLILYYANSPVDEKRITELLLTKPAKYPGCSGTRCLADNISDLKAQISSNVKGINLLSALIEEYGEEVVHFYMINIQNNAELSVRNLLKEVSKRFEGRDLSAVDYSEYRSPLFNNVS